MYILVNYATYLLLHVTIFTVVFIFSSLKHVNIESFPNEHTFNKQFGSWASHMRSDLHQMSLSARY